MDDCNTQEWAKKPIRNVLLDINGVLFDSGEEYPIEGSVEAIERLIENGIKICLVTNECTTEKRMLAQKLNNMGYDAINPSIIVSPAPVVCRYMIENDLVPHLHIWDGVLGEFEPLLKKGESNNRKPNCLVVGDCMSKIDRDFMDSSFEILANMEKPLILSMGAGRYYKDAGRMRLDTGAYVAAFEYSLGLRALNFGKPSEFFFKEALDIIQGQVDDTIMIGDDIVSDVGGAQRMGIRGFLVRTGKYKPSDEADRGIEADYVFDNLKQAVDTFIERGLLSS